MHDSLRLLVSFGGFHDTLLACTVPLRGLQLRQKSLVRKTNVRLNCRNNRISAVVSRGQLAEPTSINLRYQ